MSIFKRAIFSEIKYGDFFKAKDFRIDQPILDRTLYLSFSSILQDYNVLKNIFGTDFYRIPSTKKMIVEGDRLDNLAFERYGDPDFWWILAKYNRITDPRDLSEYTEISYPSLTHIMNYLLTKSLEWS